MTLTEKAAYIKGMMEGMAFEPQTNEDKLLKAVVDLLDDMASDLSKLLSLIHIFRPQRRKWTCGSAGTS